MSSDDDSVGKFTYFLCGVEQKKAACDSCHMTVAEDQLKPCCFELRGPKDGQKCGKRVCRSCGSLWRRVLCPPHKRLLEKEKKLS